MSKNTKAAIKSVLITALGAASIHLYSSMVTDYVIKEIDSYFHG